MITASLEGMLAGGEKKSKCLCLKEYLSLSRGMLRFRLGGRRVRKVVETGVCLGLAIALSRCRHDCRYGRKLQRGDQQRIQSTCRNNLSDCGQCAIKTKFVSRVMSLCVDISPQPSFRIRQT